MAMADHIRFYFLIEIIQKRNSKGFKDFTIIYFDRLQIIELRKGLFFQVHMKDICFYSIKSQHISFKGPFDYFKHFLYKFKCVPPWRLRFFLIFFPHIPQITHIIVIPKGKKIILQKQTSILNSCYNLLNPFFVCSLCV